MKRLILTFAAFACALLFAACVVVEKDDFEMDAPEEADLTRSVELGNNILASFRDDNVEALSGEGVEIDGLSVRVKITRELIVEAA